MKKPYYNHNHRMEMHNKSIFGFLFVCELKILQAKKAFCKHIVERKTIIIMLVFWIVILILKVYNTYDLLIIKK